MRSDRVLSLLMLLQSYGRLSATDLARRLEVSTRTIYRDIEALSAAGVPVYAERGRNGGCALVPGYRTDMTGLKTDEARALFAFAGSAGNGSSPGLEPAFRSALRKLLAALPADQRPQVDHTVERVVVETGGWSCKNDDLTHLPAIERAVWADRRIRLSYRHADRTVGSYELDPYGLVRKAGIWYLIAAKNGEPRMFRVSRAQGVEELPERVDRPEGLDLEDLWRQMIKRLPGAGEAIDARLRIRESAAAMVLRLCRWQLTEDPIELPDPDVEPGWVRFSVRFKGLLPARMLLSFGDDVEVLSPPELREELLRTAAATTALYARTPEEAAAVTASRTGAVRDR